MRIRFISILVREGNAEITFRIKQQDKKTNLIILIYSLCKGESGRLSLSTPFHVINYL